MIVHSSAPTPSGPKIILASGSPRRRELLTQLGVAFEVQVSGENEDSSQVDPKELAQELALLKGRSVAAVNQGRIVIAADTVVAYGKELLGKPKNHLENADFIRLLAGKTHQVYTGVAVIVQGPQEQGHALKEQCLYAVAQTAVTFRSLSEPEIDFYAHSGEGLDKAGGYGIQGLGMALVSHIDGEYSNVVGFPLSIVIRLLRQAGVPVWDTLEPCTEPCKETCVETYVKTYVVGKMPKTEEVQNA